MLNIIIAFFKAYLKIFNFLMISLLVLVIIYPPLEREVLPYLYAPGLKKARKRVWAREVGKNIYKDDKETQICIKKNSNHNRFYLRNRKGGFYIGRGYLYYLKVENDSIRPINDSEKELDECMILRH